MALDAFGVLIAKGSFAMQLGTVTHLGADGLPGGTGPDADTTYQAMVLTLGSDAFATAEEVEVFIGVGGVLQDVNGDDALTTGTFDDDLVNTAAGIGFYASLEGLTLVTLKNNNGTPTDPADDKSYMALELTNLSASLIGVNKVTHQRLGYLARGEPGARQHAHGAAQPGEARLGGVLRQIGGPHTHKHPGRRCHG